MTLVRDAPPTGTLRDGWRALAAQPERILVPAIAISLPALVVHVLVQVLLGVTVAGSERCVRGSGAELLVAHCGPTNARAQLTLVIALFTVFVLAHLVVAGLDRVALDVIEGREVRGPFRGWSVLRVLPMALVLSAVLTLGTLFFLLPGLVLGFFTRYALLLCLDRDLGTFAAIGASFELVATRLLPEAWFALRAAGLLVVGVLLLGVGLYVAIPVVLLAQALRYRAAQPAAEPAAGRGPAVAGAPA